ncbi:DUF3307 domain-containing protein [Candidatus Peregrinibacteria bacterium]|nr:MAG: DUF3307 domain-containing protein [Candidatus Peregrinibacteria bacterium]
MYLTLHLILSHFLADFPLQSRQLVQYKEKHFLGVLIHSFAHLVISGLLVFPFSNQPLVWWGIGLIFLVHNLSDQLKISAQKYVPHWNKFELYVLDQVIHVGTIILVSLYLIGPVEATVPLSFTSVFYNQMLMSYLIVLVLGTYFFDVSRWIFQSGSKNPPYTRDYIMMMINAMLISVVFAAAYLLKA